MQNNSYNCTCNNTVLRTPLRLRKPAAAAATTTTAWQTGAAIHRIQHNVPQWHYRKPHTHTHTRTSTWPNANKYRHTYTPNVVHTHTHLIFIRYFGYDYLRLQRQHQTQPQLHRRHTKHHQLYQGEAVSGASMGEGTADLLKIAAILAFTVTFREKGQTC